MSENLSFIRVPLYINGTMTEEETLCDRTYRAYERGENKPDKPETRSLPRHTNQDHKVYATDKLII